MRGDALVSNKTSPVDFREIVNENGDSVCLKTMSALSSREFAALEGRVNTSDGTSYLFWLASVILTWIRVAGAQSQISHNSIE